MLPYIRTQVITPSSGKPELRKDDIDITKRLVRARGLSNTVDVKVFVIDSGDYSTMLFAEEY